MSVGDGGNNVCAGGEEERDGRRRKMNCDKIRNMS